MKAYTLKKKIQYQIHNLILLKEKSNFLKQLGTGLVWNGSERLALITIQGSGGYLQQQECAVCGIIAAAVFTLMPKHAIQCISVIH